MVLVVSAIQKKIKFVEFAPLKGAILPVEWKSFSFQDWFSGNFQKHTEKYINENFGFRNFLIRLNNQIAFDLFHKAKANGVIVGKNNYLFEENYIKAYNGTDFIGKNTIKHRMEQLKFIQDTLKKLNKDLILIFAAGKGDFYPEYIPDRMKTKQKITNYTYHLKLAKEMGIEYIDFNDYFLKNKGKTKYPLYPKYGIHWSMYGMCLVADSLVHYIEHERKIDMNTIYWNKIESKQPEDEDYDIGDGMNLISKLKSFPMGYPQIQFEKDSLKAKPNILVVSDSYYWGIFNFGFSILFNESHFWYYNQEIYPDSYIKPVSTKQIDLKEEIQKHDVILLMSTQATLPNLGWGFIERSSKEYGFK